MGRKPLSLVAIVLFLATALGAMAQGRKPAPVSIPTQAECSGFISAEPLPKEVYVLDGADNDFREKLRQFATGDYVYLRGKVGAMAEGAEFRLVHAERVAALPYLLRWTDIRESIVPTVSWVPGQREQIRKSGHPYDDVGRGRVIKVTPEGAVAQITFACGPVTRGDIALPYQPRTIPDYDASIRFDRFASLHDEKLRGAITGSPRNDAYLGQGDLAYVNRGSQDGVRRGQVYRIVRTDREAPLDSYQSVFGLPRLPQETVGAMVILSVEKKSAIAVVVASAREISIGDEIQLE
jgi:hypothetical protein